MFNHLFAALKDEKGQALSEYGLILALVAVIAIGALTAPRRKRQQQPWGTSLPPLGKGTAPAGGRQ